MAMNPERPRELAQAMDAFAAECAAEDLWPTAAAQLRHTADHLRALADRLPPNSPHF